MMKEKMLKRIAAGALSLMVLGVGLPADCGMTALLDKSAITASAADASTVFGEPTAESGYELDNEHGTYTLTADITTSSYIHVPAGVTATIDLNGHTIDRGLTKFVGDGHVIQIDEGGTLTIKDTSEEKTGTIKGGYTYNGAGINNQGGTCILENITVTGRIEMNRGLYKIKIKDDGKGIPPEEVDRVTEAFYMVDKSRSSNDNHARAQKLADGMCCRLTDGNFHRCVAVVVVHSHETVFHLLLGNECLDDEIGRAHV